MKFIDFRDEIKKELCRNPEGLTWIELREKLDLPYERPCPAWVQRLEKEIDLTRRKGYGRALVWMISNKN